MALISVIIPAYRAENYIQRCLQSVLDQTHRDLEVIVVINGEPDKSRDLIEAIDDPRVRVIESRQGVGCARNTGINCSEGQYLMFLDADDWITRRDALEVLGENVKGFDAIFARYDDEKCRSSHGRVLSQEKSWEVCMTNPTKRATVTAKLFNACFIKVNKVRFEENLSLAEDSVYMVDFLLKEPKILDKEFAFYHTSYNPNSATRGMSSDKIDRYCMSIEAIYNRTEESSTYIKNLTKVFALNQLLIIFVHSHKKFSELPQYVRKVCANPVFSQTIHDAEIGQASFLRRFIFNLLKRKSYYIVSLFVKMRELRNKGFVQRESI